jgi:hypothetical protein
MAGSASSATTNMSATSLTTRNWCWRRTPRPPAGREFIHRTHEGTVAVNQKQQKHLSEICRCGRVKLEAVGRPILTASCYCASCQEAGSRFEQLASAPPILNPDGGTDYVLYRKDRVQCVTGQEYLEEHRLKPDSPTRRVIAACCNSGMFLDFTKGHWLTMYRNRFPAGAPPVEMRVMTQDRRDGVALADDLPCHRCSYWGPSGSGFASCNGSPAVSQPSVPSGYHATFL